MGVSDLRCFVGVVVVVIAIGRLPVRGVFFDFEFTGFAIGSMFERSHD